MQAKITPEGLVIRKNQIIIRLNKKETKQLRLKIPEEWPSPEFVHLEISNKCQLNCEECYVKKDGNELSTKEWKEIIDKLAAEDVWQITFGGGEPLLRKDIIELANYAKSKNMLVSMTTNGLELQKFGNELNVFDRISISFHTEIENLEKSLRFLNEKNINAAINFIVTKDTISFLKNVVDMAKIYNATLLLLTLKPVHKKIYEKMIPPGKVYKIAKDIFTHEYQKIAVDGFTCNKCYGAKRFLTIDAIGNVYPCSFLRKSSGNILEGKSIKYYMKKGINAINTHGCPYREDIK